MSIGDTTFTEPCSISRSGTYPPSLFVGVGQDEEPAPAVSCACFSRCEEARLWSVAQAAKAGGNVGKAHGQVAFDVFAPDPIGFDLVDDAGDLGPKVTRILVAGALSGIAEGLAGIAGRDEMNAAAPRSAVEGAEIVPDRRLIQGLVFHPCHESGRSVAVPLDESHSPVSGLGDVEAEVEAGIAGAEGDASEIVALRCEEGT